MTTILDGLEHLIGSLGSKFEKEVGESTPKAWFLNLCHLPDEIVAAGFLHLGRTHTSDKFHMPRAADISQWATEAKSSNWSEAWDEMLEKAHLFSSPIFKAGANGPEMVPPPAWSTPAVEQAYKQFGGHQAVLAMTEKDIPTCRAQFRQIYENATAREATKSTLTLLDGFAQKPFRVLDGGK